MNNTIKYTSYDLNTSIKELETEMEEENRQPTSTKKRLEYYQQAIPEVGKITKVYMVGNASSQEKKEFNFWQVKFK